MQTAAPGLVGLFSGEQLGKGSFGQVHKARWNNRDVAVKVIEHSASSVKAVEQVRLVLLRSIGLSVLTCWCGRCWLV